MLNYNDHDYVKERLDKDSADYALRSIEELKDDLTRQMVYGSLWQMVRDALLDPKKYLELVMEKTPSEKNLFILESLFSRASGILGSYITDKGYFEFCEKIYDFALENLEKENSREIKDVWFNLLSSSIGGCKNPEKIVQLLENKIKIKNFPFNQEQRWAAINRLAVFGHPKTDELIKKELKKDNTDKGRKEAFAATVAKKEKKKEHWELFVKGEGQSLDYLRTGMSRFFSRKQKEGLRGFADSFFKEILGIFEKKNRKYAEDFFDNLFPSVYVEKIFLKKCQDFVENNKKLPLLLKESMMESIDELQRSLKILKKFGK